MNAHILDLRETIDRLVQVADFSGVLEASKAALMDARQRHDQPLEALALLGLAQVRHYTGKFQEARVYNDGALRLARELGDPQLIMLALTIRGAIHTEIDQLAEAEDDFREALTLIVW